jgi:hypothetical protein
MPKINSDYIQGINGCNVDLNLPSQFHMACCSCGLDHFIIFEIVKKNTLRLTIYRDDHMTEAHRKSHRFECSPRKRKPSTKGKGNAK